MQKYIAVPPFPHKLAGPGVFEQELKQAGFSEASVQPTPIHIQIPSQDAFFELFFYPPAPISAALGQLSQEDQRVGKELDSLRRRCRR